MMYEYGVYGTTPDGGRMFDNIINAVLADVEIKKLTLNILTALKGWVGQAAKRTGALHIII